MSPPWEATLRLICFLGVLMTMTLWEIAAPRRPLTARKSTRWPVNLGLMAFNTVLVRLCLPVSAVAMAHYANERGWGFLNLLAWPPLVKDAFGIVVLDCLIYVQHVLFHAVPWLWRIHRLHHADVDLDVTTAVRFHTLEILLSAFVKVAAVLVIGCSVTGVVLFEILLNVMAMFNHSNAKLPLGIDRVLRCIVVTPDMHRVHHSADSQEGNHNFGFNLSWWDFLWRTYRAQPAAGHQGMRIGINDGAI
ncbi:sterol desaturase family protein [Schlesneria paludicola]|uniref:sterol desaturase family protein n=1 Tax=Schlesneria paludicola TaxID=360056 RepID=UPI0002E40AFB|nr:sterol desaturase family protein [Schlesneria paludicola]